MSSVTFKQRNRRNPLFQWLLPLDRSRFTELFGRDAFFQTIDAVVSAYGHDRPLGVSGHR